MLHLTKLLLAFSNHHVHVMMHMYNSNGLIDYLLFYVPLKNFSLKYET